MRALFFLIKLWVYRKQATKIVVANGILHTHDVAVEFITFEKALLDVNKNPYE